MARVGVNHPKREVTPEMLATIKKMLREQKSKRAIAEALGVSTTWIHVVCEKHIWNGLKK